MRPQGLAPVVQADDGNVHSIGRRGALWAGRSGRPPGRPLGRPIRVAAGAAVAAADWMK